MIGRWWWLWWSARYANCHQLISHLQSTIAPSEQYFHSLLQGIFSFCFSLALTYAGSRFVSGRCLQTAAVNKDVVLVETNRRNALRLEESPWCRRVLCRKTLPPYQVTIIGSARVHPPGFTSLRNECAAVSALPGHFVHLTPHNFSSRSICELRSAPEISTLNVAVKRQVFISALS